MDRRIQADKAFLKWCEKTSKNVVHFADAWYAAVEWADAHPDLYSVTRKAVEREREYLIRKACDWLKRNFNMPDDFESHFKKAMEKQQ